MAETKATHRKKADPQANKNRNVLFSTIFTFAKQGLTRIDFLRKVSKAITDFTQSNAIEIWLEKDTDDKVFKIIRYSEKSPITIIQNVDKSISLQRLCMALLLGNYNKKLPQLTSKGSFFSGDIHALLSRYSKQERNELFGAENDIKKYHSLAVIPILVNDRTGGLLLLKSAEKKFFTLKKIELFENYSQTFGHVLTNQRSQAALRERIKELTCLHSMNRIVEQHGSSFKDMLQNIVNLTPPAWQYTEITCGKIVFDGQEYTTTNYLPTPFKQSADIIVNNVKRGEIIVGYREKKPQLDEGPFLREERHLINSIARELAFIIERRQTLKDKEKLNDQLRHADRLATIGQLAAGIAHELNEPLNNILGLCALTEKASDLPEQIAEDITEISAFSLHAREIIRKLLLFSRQVPPQKISVSLNQIIEEGLYLLERRCTSNGIELIRSLSPGLPEITADPSQLNQVLVNLVVNAIQAMPDGGKLVIETTAAKQHIILTVRDTGTGMSKDVRKQIFIPFYTTKDIDKGTGLGLSVVHGIIEAHGGTIDVESNEDKGTCFVLRLPIQNPHRNKKEDDNVSGI